jgi:hypothetical protein
MYINVNQFKGILYRRRTDDLQMLRDAVLCLVSWGGEEFMGI